MSEQTASQEGHLQLIRTRIDPAERGQTTERGLLAAILVNPMARNVVSTLVISVVIPLVGKTIVTADTHIA